MSGFWDKKGVKTQEEAYRLAVEAPVIELDEQALEILQEDSNVDIFEEEDEDTADIMFDANLRLEQGRLYQMVMQGDIFADTNADPKAIRNVQREIRKFVRERMETMLGIRQEQENKVAIVSSPFNDMEVTVLKMLASKMSKGATEEATQTSGPEAPPPTPKKDGITSISGSLRPQTTPLRKEAKPIPKAPVPAKKQPVKSAIKSEETYLQKSIDDMSPEELAKYNKEAEERSKKQYATMPTNMVPHPSAQQLEMLYTSAATNLTIANPWRTSV